MNQTHFDQVMAVLDELLERPPGDRRGDLDKLCGDDDDLRQRVESLLEQIEDDDGFLESGAPGEVVRAHLESLDADASNPPAESKLPTRIGRYRIVGLLGRGGMGVVYEAEQEHPQRPIALKVLRPLFLSDRVRSRFDRESEILGRLRHPGIAHVYEAGVAYSGDGEPVPYFAMELVEGIPLTRYARMHDLDVRDRLSLMTRVCDAVEHAHSCGVIHRDLKPENILVGERGDPRVLDFGVARIVDPELAAASMVTETGQLVGTLPYMSPEQVGDRPADVDARSDVYALGAITFELLAERRPLDLASMSILEAVRRIREVEPQPLGSIDRKYRGDISTIVAKALEKEPYRRYASAAELSCDIHRFLADEPIVAKPQSGLYQLRKFARRNKAIVAGVLIAFTALLTGTIVATRMAIIADRERAAAVDERQRAQRETYRARIAGAAIALESHDTELARTNLDAAPEALRGWEWTHLHSRLDQSTLAVETGTGRFTDLRFGSDPTRLFAVDRTITGSWFVLPISLSAPASALERYPVAKTRPLRVPAAARWTAVRGTYFLAGEGRVDILDPSSKEPNTLRRGGDTSHGAVVLAVAADGWRAAIGRRVGNTPPVTEVRLCDLRTGEAGPAFLIPGAAPVALSADGAMLAASTKIVEQIARIHLHAAADGRQLRTLLVPGDDIMSLDISSGGGLIAAGSYNGVLRVWETGTGQLLAERRAHGGKLIYVVRFGPDEMRLASGGKDRTVHLWNVDLANDPIVLHGHTDIVAAVCFSDDGTRLASADVAGWVRVWDLGATLGDPDVLRGHGSYVNPICYSPDGRLIVSGSWDGTVRLWNATTGAPVATLELPSDAEATFGVTGLAISDDGTRLAAGTTHGDLFVHDLRTTVLVGSAELDGEIYQVTFGPGDRTLTAGVRYGELHVLDADTLEVLYREPFGFPFARSPDSTLVLLRDSDTSVIVRQAETGSTVTRLSPVDDETYAAAWSPDGARIVTASLTGIARLWDARTGADLGPLGTHTGRLHAARFHPDGTRLAIAGDDGVVRLFDPVTREEMGQFRGHDAYVFGLAWSPGGRTLASSSGDGTIRLWHTRPRRERIAP